MSGTPHLLVKPPTSFAGSVGSLRRRSLTRNTGNAGRSFREVGLDPASHDDVVWRFCQDHGYYLLTSNRNEDTDDSLEATLRKLDEKARLAPRVARERLGWQASSVGCVLVLLDESTARRRVARHAVVLDQALPARGRAVSRWIRQPAGSLAGIWFLSDTTSGNWARVSVSQMRERSCESPVLTPKLPPSSTRGDI